MQPQLKNQLLQTAFLLLAGTVIGVLLQTHVFSRTTPTGAVARRPAPHYSSATAAGPTAAVPTVAVPTVAVPIASAPGAPAGAPTDHGHNAPVKQGVSASLPITPTSPRLLVSGPVHDFGHIECGKIVEHTYVLKNVGLTPLRISHVKPDCGCAVAALASKEIAPGGQTKLKVTLNLSLQKGKQNRTFLVQSNDPAKPSMPLQLVGVATSRVQFSSDRVEMKVTAVDKPATSTLDVRATDGLTVNVHNTRTSGDNVQVAYDVVEPGKHLRVHVTVKPPFTANPFRGWVHLLTDAKEPDYRVIGIPVVAHLPGGVQVSGAQPSPAKPSAAVKNKAAPIGQAMPFSGPTLEGGKFDIAELRGSPVVVVFWASWCVACKRETPALKDLYDAYHKDGLEIVGVNLDDKMAAAVEYVRANKVPWRNVHIPVADGQENQNPLAQRFGVRLLPAMYLLDRRGVLVAEGTRGAALRPLVTQLVRSPLIPLK